MEKFNYQIVYKVNEDERIIFAGVTTADVEVLIADCHHHIPFNYPNKLLIENIIYQPVKSEKNES